MNASPVKPSDPVETPIAGSNGVVAHSNPKTPNEGGTSPKSILVIDIGGTKMKMLVTGKTKPRKTMTGREFTPDRLVEAVRGLDHEWNYEGVTIGFPGLVGPHGPQSEPGNLGPGWVGFDFASALGAPVKIVNDAVMQALGSYDKGRMLYLGLGTGIGSALIADHVIVALELGHARYNAKRNLNEMLGRDALRRIGKTRWREAVEQVVPTLLRAFIADYIVLGGGNAKNVKELPVGARLGHNLTAFRGGFRLWEPDDAWIVAKSSSGPS